MRILRTVGAIVLEELPRDQRRSKAELYRHCISNY
jgi:hypothetical protein